MWVANRSVNIQPSAKGMYWKLPFLCFGGTLRNPAMVLVSTTVQACSCFNPYSYGLFALNTASRLKCEGFGINVSAAWPSLNSHPVLLSPMVLTQHPCFRVAFAPWNILYSILTRIGPWTRMAYCIMGTFSPHTRTSIAGRQWRTFMDDD